MLLLCSSKRENMIYGYKLSYDFSSYDKLNMVFLILVLASCCVYEIEVRCFRLSNSIIVVLLFIH
jgi:hypothetical protein